MNTRELEIETQYKGFHELVKITTEHGCQEVVITFNSVCLLIYDPVKRKVLLTKQFRASRLYNQLIHNHAKPDHEHVNTDGMSIGMVAGRFDVNLTPEALAVKEALEEVGAVIAEDDVELVNDGQPMMVSSGLTTEMSYLAYIELKPGMVEESDQVYGVEEEGEKVTQVWMSLDEFMSKPLEGIRLFAMREWLRNRLKEKGEF